MRRRSHGPLSSHSLPPLSYSNPSLIALTVRPHVINIVGHTNASSIDVRVDEERTLECVVSGGRPAAQVKWFRKGVELRSSVMEVHDVETETTMYSQETDSGTHELTLSRSRIKIKPRAGDNGVVYVCEAQHPALSTPMRTAASLSVVYPPGPPEITGYADGEKARMGDVMKLQCRSKGGNPLAQLVWFKNNEQVDFSYTTVSGRESVNEYSFTIDASDNNAVYRCEASSPLISPTPLVASVKMTVHCEFRSYLSAFPSCWSPKSLSSPTPSSVPPETSSVASSACDARLQPLLQAGWQRIYALLLPSVTKSAFNSPTHLLPLHLFSASHG